MENFSIYRYMKLGIVHFKAFPQVSEGDGPIVETLRKIVEDDFWTAVEVGWMKDVKVRNEARKLLETSHMEVCYANQPRMFSGKLNVNALDSNERRKNRGGFHSMTSVNKRGERMTSARYTLVPNASKAPARPYR